MRDMLCRTGFAVVALVSLASVARADEFLNQEGDLWRASKLVGVNIYGPDQKKVGDINEVLMNKDGKAAYVVVGVGGFLGIGEKNVAIAYDKVTFSQDPINPPVTTGAAAPANNNMAANTGMSPGGNAGATPAAPANGGMAGTAPAGAGTAATGNAAAMPARSTAYPDHGTVTYTADQLKAAPTFAYAK
jgi:sporulation protein YlmC with PRC-barrel domain